MPSRVIQATVTSGSNADKKGGTYITFGSITSDSGVVYDASVTSATLYISNFKTYAASEYLNVIYGSSSGTTVARTNNLASNSSVHSSTESLINLSSSLLTSSVSTITLGVVATSGTGNKINIRDGCTITLTINYEYNYTACSAPTSVSISPTTVDAGASATLAWGGAKAGTNNPINGYVIYRSTASGSGYSVLQTVGASVTSLAVTAPSSMGSAYYYKVATLDTVDGSQVTSTVYATLTARTYTACSAPTTVTVSATGVAPGASVTLSWSGAKAGTNNAITAYQVYRATSANGSYSLLTTAATTASSGSANVAAPTANGAAYYYKVLTVGTKSGYNSAQSSTYATLTCSFTAPSAPTTVTIGGATSAYALSGTTVTLEWSGASAGTNNAITGYNIYQNGELYVEGLASNVQSRAVPAHSTAGSSYSYTVVTRGTHANSAASTACVVYTYAHPAAPTSVTVSNTSPDAGTDVTLSWSGAAAGSYNAIANYQIYRAMSVTGTYSLLTTVTSTVTSGACTVTAPSDMGSSYYYKVETVGARSGSGMSDAYAGLTAKTYTACTAPSAVSLSESLVMPGGKATLSWSAGGAGTNNEVSGYAVYCREGTGSYSLLESPASSATSLIVTAPSAPGSSYTYYVVTLGTKAGFDSAVSQEVTLSTYAYTACSAPTSVALSAAIAENSVTLAWSGAQGGTSNPITGYRIAYQDSNDNSTWGTVQELQTITTSAASGSLEVAPPETRGAYRRFLITTLGSADGYDSEEAVSASSVRKNRIPEPPAFLSGTQAYMQSPMIRLKLGMEPDGQSQTLMLSVDGGTAEAVATETRLQDLAFGDHIIRAYSVDALGAASVVVEHGLAVIDSGFTDPVLTIGETFVKAVHINELRDRINALRSYYGVAAYAWSPAPIAGETGLVSWKGHVLELREALAEAYEDAGENVPTWTELPVNCPKAAAIDELRQAVQAI